MRRAIGVGVWIWLLWSRSFVLVLFDWFDCLCGLVVDGGAEFGY